MRDARGAIAKLRFGGLLNTRLKEEDRWEIQVLHRNGNSARHIREITHHRRSTIRSVLAVSASRAASDENASSGRPTALKRAARLSMVEPFKEFLRHRSKEGLSRAELLLEARGRG